MRQVEREILLDLKAERARIAEKIIAAIPDDVSETATIAALSDVLHDMISRIANRIALRRSGRGIVSGPSASSIEQYGTTAKPSVWHDRSGTSGDVTGKRS